MVFGAAAAAVVFNSSNNVGITIRGGQLFSASQHLDFVFTFFLCLLSWACKQPQPQDLLPSLLNQDAAAGCPRQVASLSLISKNSHKLPHGSPLAVSRFPGWLRDLSKIWLLCLVRTLHMLIF